MVICVNFPLKIATYFDSDLQWASFEDISLVHGVVFCHCSMTSGFLNSLTVTEKHH